MFVDPPPAFIPDAEVGKVTLESVYSESRGMDVDLFTAVPAGFGNGRGLPVVVVCHGATATPASYEPFGLPEFLTAAVDDGAEPFVLMGAYGSALRWEPQPDGDDPRSMVLEEMPEWIDERGFDVERRALWGWSMGGYGILRMAEIEPGWARAVAAFAPAISEGDEVFASVDALEGTPLGSGWAPTTRSTNRCNSSWPFCQRAPRSTRRAQAVIRASTGTTRRSKRSRSSAPTSAGSPKPHSTDSSQELPRDVEIGVNVGVIGGE